jgi:hypothetical protein
VARSRALKLILAFPSDVSQHYRQHLLVHVDCCDSMVCPTLNPSVHSGERTGSQSARSVPVFKALRAPVPWHASCLIHVRIGDAAANPKEGITMKKLTTRLMIATAALVAAAGTASAQTMTASIPFEFRAGGRVMESGTYRVDLSRSSGTPIFRLLNFHSGEQATVLGQIPVNPQKAWKASGEGKLVFECTSGRCALAELWAGSDSQAYKVWHPKLGKDEIAVLTVIPMQLGKSE